MKTLLLIVFVCGLMVNTTAAETTAQDVFELYKVRILAADGNEAAKLMNPDTIAYYQKMLDYAKTAKAEDVKKLMMIDRLMVFTVRARMNIEQINAMDGSSFFAYAVTSGWISRDSVKNIKDYSVSDLPNGRKVLELKVGDRSMEMFQFEKIEDDWKLDLTPPMPKFNAMFMAYAQQMGKSEDEFLLVTLGSLMGRAVTADEVYKPMAAEEPALTEP